MGYIVYVKINSVGYITAVNSSAFLTDLTGWTEIDSGTGDKYHHAQGNYLPGPLMTDGGAYRYKLEDGKPVECTPEEVQGQIKNDTGKASWQDVMEAQVLYTAMMTDTILEV